MTVIAMSRTEIDRMSVLHDLADGRIKVAEASALMKLGRRQVFRLVKAYGKHGPQALVPRRRGKPSNRSGWRRRYRRAGCNADLRYPRGWPQRDSFALGSFLSPTFSKNSAASIFRRRRRVEKLGNGGDKLRRCERLDEKNAVRDTTRAATAGESKAAIQGMTANFGTWSVDEATKIVTTNIEASSNPNLVGGTQKRIIVSLTPGELKYTNPASQIGTVDDVVWKRVH